MTASRRMSDLATALGVSFSDLQQVVNQALTDAAIVEVAQQLGGVA